MFSVDHSNMPQGENYREFRQFVNSQELRNQVEKLGCQAITIISCDYLDCQTGEQCCGHFVARNDNSHELLFLISSKKSRNGFGLYSYEAVPQLRAQGDWGREVPVWKPIAQ